MNTKSTGRKLAPFRYAPEELQSRDRDADEQSADEFIDRNRKAINVDLKAAHTSIKRGEGKVYESAEDLARDVMDSICDYKR